MASQSITNRGDRPAYIPLDDGQAYTLEPGASVEVRLGNAEFAVNTFPGVEYASEPSLAVLHGLHEASTDAAVQPIADYVEANPDDIRYAVVGDTPFTTEDVTVIGSDTLAVEGGQTTASVGTAAVPTPVDDAAPAKSSRKASASTEGSGDNA